MDIVDVHEENLIDKQIPKIVIQYIKIPYFDENLQKTNYNIGIIVKHEDLKIYENFIPDNFSYDPVVGLINHLLLLRNKNFINWIKECYFKKDDILLVDLEGKQKIIPWIEYEFILSKCEFYQTKKEAKILNI